MEERIVDATKFKDHERYTEGSYMTVFALGLDLLSETKETVIHPFYRCTIDWFGSPENDRIHQIGICVDQKNNRMILFSPSSKAHAASISTSNQHIVPLQHAPRCPFRQLHFMSPPQILSSDAAVRVGVTVVVENEKCQVLVTRRAPHMRTCK